MEDYLKYFNGTEYIAIKNVKFNEKTYTIYFDTNTQTNALICNESGDILQDKSMIKEIMDANFPKASDIVSSIFEEWDGHFEDEIEEVSYPEETKSKIIKNTKLLFWKKFGHDVLTEQELDRRLKKIKDISLSKTMHSGKDTSIAEWDSEKRTIRILSKDLDTSKIYNRISFHEGIHAITDLGGNHGARRYLRVNEDEYEYGIGIDEGIVSYIEDMESSKRWKEFARIGSYDEPRRIIGEIATLYDNMHLGQEHSFIEQYIIDPSGTLGRLNEVFEENSRIKNPNLTKREHSLDSMRKSLNFVLKLDDLISSRDPEERKQLSDECETILADLYICQTRNTEAKSLDQLYEILYNIEGFNTNLTERNSQISALIEEKIREYQVANPDVTLSEIIELLPNKVSSSPEISKEDRLFFAISDEELPADPRYEAVLKEITKIQSRESNNKSKGTITKSQIGRAFGISVPVEIKDEVENHMNKEMEEQHLDGQIQGGQAND